MSVSVTANLGNVKELLEKLKALKEKAVYVGFPAEANEMVEGSTTFNLASLAMVLEFGNQHIPSRPFLRQTLIENQKKYAEFFTEQFKQGIEVEMIYKRLALMAEADVQANIKARKFQENKTSTKIAWRLKDVTDPMRRKRLRKTLNPETIDKTPLIWDGHLWKSVRGVVK